VRIFVLLGILYGMFLSTVGKAGEEEEKFSTLEGSYQVQSIGKNSGFVTVRFQKVPFWKKDKIIELELDSLNDGLIQKGAVVNITAVVVADEGKKQWEAQQVLLNLPRDKGKTRVWLLSRKRKMLNFDNATLLKMHGSESDYYIL
jgi:hypothetical protein